MKIPLNTKILFRSLSLLLCGLLLYNLFAIGILGSYAQPVPEAAAEPAGKELIPDDALRIGIVEEINAKYPATGQTPALPEGGLVESTVTGEQLALYSRRLSFSLRGLGVETIEGLQAIKNAVSIDLSHNNIRDFSSLEKGGDPDNFLEGNLWGVIDHGVSLDFSNNPIQKFPTLLAGYAAYNWGTTDFSNSFDYSPFALTILDPPEVATLHDLPYHFVNTGKDLIDLGERIPVTLTDGKTDEYGYPVEGTGTGAVLESGYDKYGATVSGIRSSGIIGWRIPCYAPWGVGKDGQEAKATYTYKYEQQVSLIYTVTVKSSVPAGTPIATGTENTIYPTFDSNGNFIPTEKDDLGIYIVQPKSGALVTNSDGTTTQTCFGSKETKPVIDPQPKDGWTAGTVTVTVGGVVVKENVSLNEANQYFAENGVSGTTEVLVNYNPAVSISSKTGTGGWVSATSDEPTETDVDVKPGFDPNTPDQDGVVYGSGQSVTWKPDLDNNYLTQKNLTIMVGETSHTVQLQDGKAYLVTEDGTLGSVLTVKDSSGNEQEVTYTGEDLRRDQITLHFPSVTDLIHVIVLFDEKTVTLHIRQVVEQEDVKPTLALPTDGFAKLKNAPYPSNGETNTGRVFHKTILSGQEDIGYTTLAVKPRLADNGITIDPIVPMYYSLKKIHAGTSEEGQELLENYEINCDEEEEWWITIYLKPTTPDPERFYSQQQLLNEFGTLSLPQI